jgi:hypothetical protein
MMMNGVESSSAVWSTRALVPALLHELVQDRPRVHLPLVGARDAHDAVDAHLRARDPVRDWTVESKSCIFSIWLASALICASPVLSLNLSLADFSPVVPVAPLRWGVGKLTPLGPAKRVSVWPTCTSMQEAKSTAVYAWKMVASPQPRIPQSNRVMVAAVYRILDVQRRAL